MEEGGEWVLDVYEREVRSGELGKLPRDFYRRAAGLLGSEGSELLAELFLCRLAKIVGLLVRGEDVDPSLLAEEEARVLRSVREALSSLRRVAGAAGGERRSGNALVVFVEPHPPLMAADGGVYGPFARGDVAYLPRADALRLQGRGIVMIIKR